MPRILAALLLALVLLARPAAAQTTDTAAVRPTASHVAAIEELLGLMDVERNLRLGVEMAMEQQIAANPEMAEYQDIIRDFIAKYLTWNDIRPEFVQLYAETYTEPEVRGLIAFYRTPLGQRVIEQEPRLMARAGQIGQRRMQEHMPELVGLLMERMMAEAGAGAGTGTPRPKKPGQP